MKKCCNNCALYCHSDGMCYGSEMILTGNEVGVPIFQDPRKGSCGDWAFDGLEDWEREDEEVLVTMA